MRSEEEVGEGTNSPGDERSGEVGWDGLAWSEGLGAMRLRVSSSWASEEEKGRAPASGALGAPCMLNSDGDRVTKTETNEEEYS
jgi:hypothetical protein